MSPKGIAILIDSFESGGAQKQAFLLAKHLGLRNTVYLIVYHGHKIDAKFQSRFNELTIEPIILNGNPLRKFLQLVRFFRTKKVDVVFTYLLLPNLIGGLAANLAGVKLKVGGIRNSILDPKKEPIERFIHNYVNDFSVFNNRSGVKLLCQKGFRKDKAVVIPNCFDIGKKLIIKRPDRLVTILSVGRFTEQKDYLTAIRVISQLKTDGLAFKYVVVGWGVLENQLREWITEFHLMNHVELVINPANMDDYYQNADIFLMTSLFEGLSNAVMEAMSFSLPVVATRAGDNDQLVDSEKTGFLAEIGDVQNLAKGLSELISSPNMRNEFGERGYEKLKNEYGVERFVDRYEQFIKQNV